MYINEGHICKGCVFDNISSSSTCVIYESGKSKKCPCTTCIVNVMCKTTCKAYVEIKNIADKQLYNWRGY